MEAAYGLAITVTMLMTTILLTVYLAKVRQMKALAVGVFTVFTALELVFFLSSLSKFFKGGYFAVLIASCLFVIMLTWHIGTQVEQMQSIKLKIRDYLSISI